MPGGSLPQRAVTIEDFDVEGGRRVVRDLAVLLGLRWGEPTQRFGGGIGASRAARRIVPGCTSVRRHGGLRGLVVGKGRLR